MLTDRMDIAVSERFRDQYARSSLTGLTFSEEPIQFVRSSLKYFMAIPKRTRTLLDEAASGLVFDKVFGCDKCRVMSLVKLDRVVLKSETWEGEDVFMIGSISSTMTSAKFVDFVKKHDFTNFQFVDQDEFHLDFSV